MWKEKETSNSKKWMGSKELAKHLGVSTRTIFNWKSQRRIPFHKVGGRVLFNVESVEKALAPYEVDSISFV